MNNLNYGVIGNGRSAALISDKGSIDWCCLPDFDSPSVFAKLLDKDKGGYFSIVVDDSYEISQNYVARTNVLCTSYRSEQGSFDVFDFMPRYHTSEKDYYAPAEIYRYIIPKGKLPKMRVQYRPSLNYAQDGATNIVESNYIRTISNVNPTDCIYLYSSLPLQRILEEDEILLAQPQFLLLTYNQKLIEIDIPRVDLEYQRTRVYWLNWVNRSRKFTLYNDVITRSVLVLNIMTNLTTGAVLAALTTSLPETIGEVRNWDYRFCWLRDASMSIDTLQKMGHYKSSKRFLGFIKRILKNKHDSFQIMYGIRGERELEEFELSHLDGYESSKPVRIGNAAYFQRQNDVFGYLLNVIYQYYLYFQGTLDEIEDMWEIVRNIARTITTQWEKPDKGIWEIRNEEKHFVFSKIMSWVAIDRAAKIAVLLNQSHYARTWTDLAIDIKQDVMTNGWSVQLQSFTQTYGSNDLDASLLLMAEYGFISVDDPRYHSTVLAIKDALFHKGLMYRYITSDDFGKPSSSFTICTFWMVQSLYHIGREQEAKTIFDELLSYSNHLGLFSEDIDFESKRLLGNFPQAYSHLALINTAILFADEKYTSSFIKP